MVTHRITFGNRRDQWEWSISSEGARIVCRLTIPYLREKRSQAVLLLDWPVVGKGNTITEEVQAERERIIAELTRLKHVTYYPDGQPMP